MARPSSDPLEPRLLSPDIPSVLKPTRSLDSRTEIWGSELADTAGDVDAGHSRILESRVVRAQLKTARLTGATLTDVVLEDVSAVEFAAADSRWRTVEWRGGRAATLEGVRTEWDSVLVAGVRFEYANLASAALADVLFRDCTFGTLDLPQATLSRVRFEGCRADEVDTRGLVSHDADLRGLDAAGFTDVTGLRGATLSPQQSAFHGQALARALGVIVR